MKVTLSLDGETKEVEVDLAAGTVRIGKVVLPVTIVARTFSGAELDIAGERLSIQDWPGDQRTPSSAVTVDGERFDVTVRTEGERGRERPVPSSRWGPDPDRNPEGSTVSDAIVPPMPGRVIEVRVREGERVAAGAVLLVLEAMKMRNEIQAPRAGVVRDLRVRAGSSVKGREPMLRVVAEPE